MEPKGIKLKARSEGISGMGISMRLSMDSIKAKLRDESLVTRDRQTGKTTALLEYVHERCAGKCFIIVPRLNVANFTSDNYRKRYPEDEKPRVLALSCISDRDALGSNLPWVTDEVWPESVAKKAPAFKYLTWIGGVGTPMCMDMLT